MQRPGNTMSPRGSTPQHMSSPHSMSPGHTSQPPHMSPGHMHSPQQGGMVRGGMPGAEIRGKEPSYMDFIIYLFLY